MFTSVSSAGIKKNIVKARASSERKRSKWVSVLYELLYDVLERPQKAGFRFESRLFRQIELDTNANSADPTCNSTTVCPQTGILNEALIQPMQITRFMQWFNIACCTQTGKLMVSPTKYDIIDRQVAFHVENLFLISNLDRLEMGTSTTLMKLVSLSNSTVTTH